MTCRSHLFCTCVLGFFFVSLPCSAQTFENAAQDTRESPYIQRMIVSSRDSHLVLRFEGNLQLGRRVNVVKRNEDKISKKKRKYASAVHQLRVTLNNEALENLAVTITPDAKGVLKAFPENLGATVKTDAGGMTLRIPLKLVVFSPLDILAETDSIYYAKAQMVGSLGRNLFSGKAGRPIRVKINSLQRIPEACEATNLKATNILSGSVTLVWQTPHRTTAEVTLRALGKTQQTRRRSHYTRDHRITVPNLQPKTSYVVHVTGVDFAGQPVKRTTMTFQTPVREASGKRDAWLRVQGQYIVDSTGRSFALGGYSQFVGEYWGNEFPRYGTMALTARYFRSLGFNVCRLGLVEDIPSSWAASIMRERNAFDRYGGAAGFVKKFLRPLVDQITGEGVYVIIDWHDSYDLDEVKLRKIGDFWEAVAREFKDEPRVAMYQLLNEPCFKGGQNRPDLAPRIRKIIKGYIRRIRKHDKRHIIMVPDWNCGWGWATESQWQPVNFDPGDPQRQIIYSKHIAREHLTDAFMAGGVDVVSDRWDVPILFDEVESGVFMNARETGWFYDFLGRNSRKYGFAIWVAGQYPPDLARTTSAFAQAYLPRTPFGNPLSKPIVQWWRLKDPKVGPAEKRPNQSTGKKDTTYTYRYRLPKALPAGDYGLVMEGTPNGTPREIALVPDADPSRLLGTWLGSPGRAGCLGFPNQAGQSAVNNASYFHALEPFSEVKVVLINQSVKNNWTEAQLFRLNPKHQMPVPKVDKPYLK